MDFVSNQKEQIEKMLQELSVSSIEDLFSAVPKSLKLPPQTQDDGLSEYEGIQRMETLSEENTFHKMDSYLGAGAYEHHIPALVSAICSRSEFLTAYTPYQPEVSQGMLQAIFEFQSALCALTGLDVANASVYDGASACAEAMLMTLRAKKGRSKVIVCESIHPAYLEVVKQYLDRTNIELIIVPFLSDGTLDQKALFSVLDEQTAGVLFPYPSFFGSVEDLKPLIDKVHEVGALAAITANPMIFSLYQSAAELNADIAVGDCQPFGLSLSFGGPYAGYISCKQDLVRQMPGRLVGETVDEEGKRGFVLTLQAREQHIRREKATSNICTNQALAALASLVTMLWYGKHGVKELSLTNFQRTAYLRQKLLELGQFSPLSNAPHFNEVALKIDADPQAVQNHFHSEGIEPGVHLGRFFPSLNGVFLIAVTETKSKEQLNRYIEVARRL